MKLIFSENAWEDYLYWQKIDKKILNRINKLIKETKREPFAGAVNRNRSNIASLVIGPAELTTSTAWSTKSRMTPCSSPSFGTTTDLALIRSV